MTRRSTTSRRAPERGDRATSPEAPSSAQLDYFLARELFRRAHPVPSLRASSSLGRHARRLPERRGPVDQSRQQGFCRGRGQLQDFRPEGGLDQCLP